MTDLVELAASCATASSCAFHEGGYSSATSPSAAWRSSSGLAGVDTGVVDPWLDDNRTVAALPLRADETAAVDVAAEIASRAWPRSSSR